jgi:pimeloyl-ACP methyl ester carboxylesterase
VVTIELKAGDPQAVPSWFAEAIAMPHECGMAAVGGACIEWRAWGNIGKPGLLLLPGSSAHAGWWSFLAPFFADHYRVATLSWSGMGGSDWRPHYSIDLYAQEVWAVAEAAGLLAPTVKPILVGHSFGAVPMLATAARHGEAMRLAILVDSRLRAGKQWQPKNLPERRHRRYATKEQAIESFRLAPAQPTPNSFILRWLAEEAIAPAPGNDGWSLRFDPNLRLRTDMSYEGDLIGEARCPLAFIRGGLSVSLMDEIWADHRRQAPHGTLFIEIPEAGHHVMIDQPIALAAVLRTLMQSL